ncbi:unnamed protein product [Rotaria sp. Silwood1]|nr:unnamed protein product [Rotaria sp. Silwood1]CAF4586834.1 unnamed protein product [Rotaria sp. Silwood1]
MLPNSNGDISYHTNVPTRFNHAISYVDFNQDDESLVDGYKKNESPLARTISIQRSNRQQTILTPRRSNSSLGVTSLPLLRETTTIFDSERKRAKPSVVPIEEDDDDAKQSTTESTPPTQTSKSTVTSDTTQQISPIEMSVNENNNNNNNNNNSSDTTLNGNDNFENNKNYIRRDRTVSPLKHLPNNNIKRSSSDALLLTLDINNEEESPHIIKSITTTKINQTKLIPKNKYMNKTPTSTLFITKTGKSSPIKNSSSLNTPRTLAAIPSVNAHSFQGVLVRFFRNGDEHHHGVKLAINEFELKSWEAFLNYLDRQPRLRLPTGAIKHVYSLTGQEIRSVNQFQNRQSYVVAVGAFTRTNYRFMYPLFTEETDVNLNTNTQQDTVPYWNTRLSVHPRWHSPPPNNEQIFLLPYSQLNMYESLIFNRNVTQTFEEWLQDQVTDLLTHYTNHENVRHLFGITKDSFIEIKSFSKLFNMIKITDTFIGCTENEYADAKHYLGKMTPHELFTNRQWLRRSIHRTNQKYVSKQIIENSKVSLSWIHGYHGENELTKRLYTLPENEILYVIGSICILYESKLKQQRFYTKHNNTITCAHIHQFQSLVASSEISSSKINQRALIHIWDHVKLRTITEIRKDQFGSYISLLSFSPKTDDDLILIISRDKPKIILFVDWKRNELIYSITCKSDNILSVLFVFNTTEWIACVSQQNLLFYHINWSLRPLHMLERRESEVQNIYTGAAACETVGERLLVGDKVGSIHIWRLINNEPKLVAVQECLLENDVETIVSISRDVFLFANGQNQIKIWNMNSNTIEHIRLNETIGSIQSICCIRQGSVSVALAIGTKLNYIISKEIGKEQFDVIMRGHTSPTVSICCQKYSRYYFSISSDRYLFKWNHRTKVVEWSTKSTQPISCADLHPERNIIVLGTETSKLLIYDTLTSYYITTVTLKVNTSVKSVRFSPDGSNLAVGLQNGNAFIFNVLGNGDFALHTKGILHNDKSPVNDLIWSIDSKYLLVIYADNDYNIWSISTFEVIIGINIQNIKWHDGLHPILCNALDKSTIDLYSSVITLTPNLILSCGKDGQLRLLRNHYERNSQTFKVGLGPIQSIIPSTLNNTFLLSMRDYPMNKRSLNDTLFGIQGVNPGFSAREDPNAIPSQQTAGKVVLKRQQLLACPYLKVDEQIKLLNLQKNCIAKIANLDHLTSLVVLDLCENEIDCIQGLDNLCSLRILRLANNKIKQIKNLDTLEQLDVLDLNGNQISRIENFKNLTRLRVLNLSHNRIEKCENLRTLKNLVELNLQGNLITTVCDLETLPIQRLFLSFNKIRRFDDIRCISKLTSLECLSLEGNPLAFTAAYEQIILSQSQSSTIKQDNRQPMNMDQRISRVIRMQHNTNNNANNNANINSSFNSNSINNINNNNNNNTEITHINRDRRLLDTLSNQQDSMSERSDTDIDSVKTNPPPVFSRTSSITQQKPTIKPIQETINPLLVETKLNPIIAERSILAKSLVQSAIDDAFRKESVTVQLARCWPLLLTQLINDSN